jgi:hypothetical protein
MTKKLRCYFAGSRHPDEYPYVEACFAYSHREAKPLLWRDGSEIKAVFDGEYFDMSVKHQPEHDSLAEKYGITSPHVIGDDKLLREMGWSIEGDSRCANCNLAEYDGEYPLCEHCDQCEECGHPHDCPEHGKAGGA